METEPFWLETLLTERGYRPRDVTAALDLTPQKTTPLLKGTRQVQMHELIPLAALLDMDLGELVSRLTGQALPAPAGSPPPLDRARMARTVAVTLDLYARLGMDPAADPDGFAADVMRYYDRTQAATPTGDGGDAAPSATPDS